MNLWIDIARDSLVAAIGEIDCLLLNDAELRMLTGEPNLAMAAKAVMEMGPSIVVAKRGEYGAGLFTAEDIFAIPALPLEEVCDPTGAGDSFAGGFLGYLDGAGAGDGDPISGEELRRAMVVRLDDGLLQRPGLRHRAGQPPEPRGDRRSRRRVQGAHALRARLSDTASRAQPRPSRRLRA